MKVTKDHTVDIELFIGRQQSKGHIIKNQLLTLQLQMVGLRLTH